MISEAYDLVEQGKSLIDTALEEEQECYDNLPEGIQYSEKGEEMEENIENLQECSDGLDEVLHVMEEFL